MAVAAGGEVAGMSRQHAAVCKAQVAEAGETSIGARWDAFLSNANAMMQMQ